MAQATCGASSSCPCKPFSGSKAKRELRQACHPTLCTSLELAQHQAGASRATLEPAFWQPGALHCPCKLQPLSQNTTWQCSGRAPRRREGPAALPALQSWFSPFLPLCLAWSPAPFCTTPGASGNNLLQNHLCKAARTLALCHCKTCKPCAPLSISEACGLAGGQNLKAMLLECCRGSAQCCNQWPATSQQKLACFWGKACSAPGRTGRSGRAILPVLPAHPRAGRGPLFLCCAMLLVCFLFLRAPASLCKPPPGCPTWAVAWAPLSAPSPLVAQQVQLHHPSSTLPPFLLTPSLAPLRAFQNR